MESYGTFEFEVMTGKDPMGKPVFENVEYKIEYTAESFRLAKYELGIMVNMRDWGNLMRNDYEKVSWDSLLNFFLIGLAQHHTLEEVSRFDNALDPYNLTQELMDAFSAQAQKDSHVFTTGETGKPNRSPKKS